MSPPAGVQLGSEALQDDTPSRLGLALLVAVLEFHYPIGNGPVSIEFRVQQP